MRPEHGASAPEPGLRGRDLLRLRVLDELERRANVSQRALAEGLGVTTSRLNRLIGGPRDAGRIEVLDPSVRPFAYRLTEAGRAYRQRLNHRHYRSVMSGFRRLRRRTRRRLEELEDADGERVLMVGAGRAAPTLLADEAFQEGGLEVVGLLGDDPGKRAGAMSGAFPSWARRTSWSRSCGPSAWMR